MQVYNQSDLLELFDLPCAACESHSVRDQLRKLGWSPDTTDAQLLAALPADPQQQHACRMHLLGLAASSDDWHTGMDSAFARHTARVFHKEVRASPRPMEGSALAAFEAAGQMQSHNACSLSAASACLTGGRFRNRESESRPQVPPWASRKAGMSPGEADAGQSLRTGSSLTPPPVSHSGFPDSCSAARAFRKRRRRLAFCVLLRVQ